jgi:hypothetical protein
MISILAKTFDVLTDHFLRPLDKWLIELPPKKRFLTLFLTFSLLSILLNYRWIRDKVEFGTTIVNVAWSSSDKIYLPSAISLSVGESVRRSQTSLISALERIPSTNVDSWIVAQMVVAVDTAAIPDKEKVIAYWKESMLANSGAWQSFSQYGNPPHIPASAWVMIAMDKLQVNASSNQISFFLNEQLPNGFWPVYPTEDAEAASTYATIMTLMALHTQLGNPTISSDLRDRIRVAIDQGTSSLLSTRNPINSRWKDYPFSVDGRYVDGLSGQTIYALHDVAATGLAAIDKKWLDSLPNAIPTPDDADISLLWIDTKRNGSQQDQISQYKLPWVLIGTATAYRHSDLMQKASAAAWLERAIGNSGILDCDTCPELYQRAELTEAMEEILR